jgi:hypothetical protein
MLKMRAKSLHNNKNNPYTKWKKEISLKVTGPRVCETKEGKYDQIVD